MYMCLHACLCVRKRIFVLQWLQALGLTPAGMCAFIFVFALRRLQALARLSEVLAVPGLQNPQGGAQHVLGVRAVRAQHTFGVRAVLARYCLCGARAARTQRILWCEGCQGATHPRGVRAAEAQHLLCGVMAATRLLGKSCQSTTHLLCVGAARARRARADIAGLRHQPTQPPLHIGSENTHINQGKAALQVPLMCT